MKTIEEARGRGAPTYAMEKERDRVLAKERTCDDQFLGKGPLKPDYLVGPVLGKMLLLLLLMLLLLMLSMSLFLTVRRFFGDP